MAKHDTIAERISQLRGRAGMSREALAAKAGCSVQALRLIEVGVTTSPRAETLKGIARALKVGVDALTGGAA